MHLGFHFSFSSYYRDETIQKSDWITVSQELILTFINVGNHDVLQVMEATCPLFSREPTQFM